MFKIGFIALHLLFGVAPIFALPSTLVQTWLLSQSLEQQNLSGGSSYLSQASGAGQSTARATLGSLGVLATDQTPNSTGPVSSAQALADWADQLTVNAPGLSGQEGELSFTLNPNGSIAASGTGPNWTADASITYYVYTNTETDAVPNANISGEFGTTASGSISGPPVVSTSGTDFTQKPFSETVAFQFGTPFILELRIDGIVDARIGSPINGENSAAGSGVSFLDSLDWGGITGVSTSSGAGITDFTVTSVSGTNYLGSIAAPVPEPSSSVLLLFGIAGILFLRKSLKLPPLDDQVACRDHANTHFTHP